MHYGFVSRFCNPYAGHEKGNVENRVDYLRCNLLTPVPILPDLESYNRRLLTRTESLQNEFHYKKHKEIKWLFKEDRSAWVALLKKSFDLVEFQLKRADKQGKVQVHGPHYYSVPPEYASSEAVVALRYLTVSLQDRLGNEVAKYERAYTARRTDRKNAWFSLQRLVIKPNAWPQPALRNELPSKAVQTLDKASVKKRFLLNLVRLYEQHDRTALL